MQYKLIGHELRLYYIHNYVIWKFVLQIFLSIFGGIEIHVLVMWQVMIQLYVQG